MGLTKEEKEKIEIIDFPGLDTDKFETARNNAEYLLKIIDGFIHIIKDIIYLKSKKIKKILN